MFNYLGNLNKVLSSKSSSEEDEHDDYDLNQNNLDDESNLESAMASFRRHLNEEDINQINDLSVSKSNFNHQAKSQVNLRIDAR